MLSTQQMQDALDKSNATLRNRMLRFAIE